MWPPWPRQKLPRGSSSCAGPRPARRSTAWRWWPARRRHRRRASGWRVRASGGWRPSNPDKTGRTARVPSRRAVPGLDRRRARSPARGRAGPGAVRCDGRRWALRRRVAMPGGALVLWLRGGRAAARTGVPARRMERVPVLAGGRRPGPGGASRRHVRRHRRRCRRLERGVVLLRRRKWPRLRGADVRSVPPPHGGLPASLSSARVTGFRRRATPRGTYRIAPFGAGLRSVPEPLDAEPVEEPDRF